MDIWFWIILSPLFIVVIIFLIKSSKIIDDYVRAQSLATNNTLLSILEDLKKEK